MKLPDQFFQYFALVTILLLTGVGIVVIESFITHPAPVPFNTSELWDNYQFHTAFVIPRMQVAFPLLLFCNAGVALFMLLVPLYWVWIWWFRRDLLDRVLLLMQGQRSCSS